MHTCCFVFALMESFAPKQVIWVPDFYQREVLEMTDWAMLRICFVFAANNILSIITRRSVVNDFSCLAF